MENREIDALIAEKVMGWKKEVMSLGDNHWEETWVGDNYTVGEKHWNPSSNITDAWKVVEKLRGQDILLDIETFKDYYVVIPTVNGLVMDNYAYSRKNVPLAICEAAVSIFEDFKILR